MIVPTKTMNLLGRVLGQDDETVALQLEETQIKLKSSRATIFSRLIDGNFPDYEAVVPRDRDAFKASKLLRELRSVLPSTSMPSRLVAVDEIPRTGSGKAIRKQLELLPAEEAR